MPDKRSSKPKKPAADKLSSDALNERARLYPWAVFDQGQLRVMTGFPREAVSAAFADGEFPSQFGCSRPEDVFKWVRTRDAKIQTKAAKAAKEAQK